jgi:hypothetical protein
LKFRGYAMAGMRCGSAAEMRCRKGFGDLGYGHIVVARSRRADAAVAPGELDAPSTRQSPIRRGDFPWTVSALAALAVAILAGALHVRGLAAERSEADEPTLGRPGKEFEREA